MKKTHAIKRGKKEASTRSSNASSVRERWVVAASIIGFLVFLALKTSMVGISQQRATFDKQLAIWKQAYHLTDEQTARIRQIEIEYHGNGNPFASRGPGTPEEDEAHYFKMSQAMNPEDAERFLYELKRGKQHH